MAMSTPWAAVLDNEMKFASAILQAGISQLISSATDKMFASSTFEIEVRFSGRIMSLSPSVIPSVEGIVVSAVLIDVLRPAFCVFGGLVVQVHIVDKSTVTCSAPVLSVGRLVFSVLHSLGSTSAIEALVVAPPLVTHVEHASFGVMNRSLDIKVFFQYQSNDCEEMSCFFPGLGYV